MALVVNVIHLPPHYQPPQPPPPLLSLTHSYPAISDNSRYYQKADSKPAPNLLFFPLRGSGTATTAGYFHMPPSAPANHDPALSHSSSTVPPSSSTAPGASLNNTAAGDHPVQLAGLDQNQIMSILRHLPNVFKVYLYAILLLFTAIPGMF